MGQEIPEVFRDLFRQFAVVVVHGLQLPLELEVDGVVFLLVVHLEGTTSEKEHGRNGEYDCLEQSGESLGEH